MRRFIPFLMLILAFSQPASAFAQEEEPALDLKLRRDFGFGGGSTIQGRFTISADGPEDLDSVTFLIDGEIMAEVNEEPFSFSFSTSEYALGEHRLAASGRLESGAEIRSEAKVYKFISAEEGWDIALRIVVPILVIAVGLTAIAGLGSVLLGRGRKAFEPGQYGPAGGAVCSRCGNPYSRIVLAPNLLFGKLSRCPHCGRWAIVRRASEAQLKTAEEKWAQEQSRGKLALESDTERLHRMLDESRFEDG